MSPTGRGAPAAWKLGTLSMLYFVQGLPFGFQSKGLRLALTQLGLPMTTITLAGVLSLPWSLKPLLGPFVDRHGSARFGRRKSWIVPLQGLLGLSCLAAGACPPDARLAALLAAVLAMNVFAAGQDVPVDGLAVDLLGPGELGLGNAIQVVGYKLGMLVGGSVLLSQLPLLGWAGMFEAMAALCFAVMVATAFVPEPAPSGEGGGAAAPLGWRELGRRLTQLWDSPAARWLLVAVATYKLGETVSDVLFEPWLLRRAGYTLPEAAAFGGWGVAGSLVGSAAGGLLATRAPLLRAVWLAAFVRCLPLLGMWALAQGLVPASGAAVIAVTVAEHFFGGMLTTAMFALMMSRVDRRIGATHFTLLAAVEVAGKSLPGLGAGALADGLGWGPAFLAGAALSLGYLAVLARLGTETGLERAAAAR